MHSETCMSKLSFDKQCKFVRMYAIGIDAFLASFNSGECHTAKSLLNQVQAGIYKINRAEAINYLNHFHFYH